MMDLILDGYGKSIRKKDNRILIKQKDETIYDEIINKIDSILIFGKGSITFDAMTLLSKNNKKLVSVSYNGQINYILNNIEDEYNINLRRKQFEHSNSNQSIDISKEIIKSKITNQKNTLRTLNKQKKNPLIKENYGTLLENIEQLNKPYLGKNNILGIEGQSSQLYWQAIKEVIPAEYKFSSRTKKPATDITNAMLNYGYAILASKITLAIVKEGLDPYIGVLHSDLNNRTSLTYDLIEEFRQQLVDKAIISIIHNNQIKPHDFDENNMLPLDKRKIIIEKILSKIHSKIEYNHEKTTYQEIIDSQIKLFKKALLRGTKYKGFALRW